MTLAEKIAALRGERKLSQGDLAEKLDVSRQSVSKWETGQAVPELDKIIKLADLFGVTVDELVRDETAPQSEPPQEDAPGSDAAPAPVTKIVYMERPRGFTPVQALGIVLIVMGLLGVILGVAMNGAYMALFGAAMVILGLPFALAKKHPFLAAGWVLCLGSCVGLNPFTSIAPWGLWGGIRALRAYMSLNDFAVPGYRSTLIAIGVAIVRGILALVLLGFTGRACLRRWKGRQQSPEESGGSPGR